MYLSTKRARSIYYAAWGLLVFFKKEANGQIQLMATIAVTIGGSISRFQLLNGVFKLFALL
jgi:preprotein translocase subunit Sec61beta